MLQLMFNDIPQKFASNTILKQCENVKELNKSSVKFESNLKKKKIKCLEMISTSTNFTSIGILTRTLE